MPSIDAIVFDLDGTLADTLAPIAAAGNHMLQQFGRPPIPTERFRYLAGQGLEYLVVEALGTPAGSPEVDRGITAFRAFYGEHGDDMSEPYPGIPAMLDAIAERGLPMGILSNKPHTATVSCVQRLLPEHDFKVVQGHAPPLPLKPDPGGAQAVLERMGVEPSRCVFVGDTRVDMETAVNTGMVGVGVTWGFRDEDELRDAGAQAIATSPAEVIAQLDTLA